MRVSEIIKSLPFAVKHNGSDPDIKNVTLNSRQVRPGYLFAAILGSVADGRDYINDALKRGAVAVVSEQPASGCDCQLIVADAHLAFARIAAVLNDNPSHKLNVVGITGTNGKTTAAYMMRDVLRFSGNEVGLISTIAYEIGGRTIAASRTTPDAATVQDLLRQMVSIKCKSAVMEVSSHSLMQQRTAGVDFDVALFTNLTHEHLDYHKTMNAYYEAKARLFRSLKASATAVINVDDEWGVRLMGESLPCKKLSYSVIGGDVVAEDVVVDRCGCRFVAKTPWGSQSCSLQLLGRHNVANALACIAASGVLGIDMAVVSEGLQQIKNVRGRLEPLICGQRFGVYVDYAHTGDALDHALATVREITDGRLIVVFGCGGDRDKGKRPIMGRLASTMADVVVVTSDNPRSENPAAIIEEIINGVDNQQAKVEVVEDRRDAIICAIKMAENGDSVLIAGKGHEAYQESQGRMTPFDDRRVARECLL